MPHRNQTGMITRCPQCATAFRLSQAQLEARAGQVRCGACAHVFDAQTYLVEDSPAGAATDEGMGKREIYVDTPSLAGVLPFDHAPAKKPVGAAWLIGSVALALVLIAQCLYFLRGDLAILLPETKPVLKDICGRIGCSLPLPHRVELMSIEASDLQADSANPNVMVLTATLRNRAAFPQAHPALELSLTDAQDLPLARRVLFPADYLSAPPDPEIGFAPGADLALKVTFRLVALKATGYRLYLFYP